MLIIFDLDDTLIDTSGAITPFKLDLVLKKMVLLGLQVSNYEKAYQELLEENHLLQSSQKALESFAKRYQVPPSHMHQLSQELYSPLPSSFMVPTTPFANEVLIEMKASWEMALVTAGDPILQRDKLEKAGIDSSLFSMIHTSKGAKKKPYYIALQQTFSLPPQQIWVCGDRIEADLKPAFELGFRTVHMRWGRGAFLSPEEWIDGSILNLKELEKVMNGG